MLEFEKKIMLTYDEYKSLCMLMAKDVLPVTQINYYFDTDDFSMNKKGITYRIRAKDGKFKATVKNHGVGNAECSVENNINLLNDFDLNFFKNLGLNLQGTMTTERLTLYKDEFCTAVLDRNIYLGFTDFELEVEYASGCEEKAVALIEKLAENLSAAQNIISSKELFKRVGKGKSKSERFFKLKSSQSFDGRCFYVECFE